MLDDTLKRMEHAGKYEKDAAWALFHGDKNRAISALSNSGGKLNIPCDTRMVIDVNVVSFALN